MHSLGTELYAQLKRLDERGRERFTEAVEASLDVSTRQQFFVWAQSSLQGVIPHEILLCGIRASPSKPMTLHPFNACRYFRDEQFAAVSHHTAGLAAEIERVASARGIATFCCPQDIADKSLMQLISRNELKNLATHLVHGVAGHVEAVYAFSRVHEGPGQPTVWSLELVTPHVHRAFLRVLGNERREAAPIAPRQSELVTGRQLEILNLIKAGSTNAQIAERLGCSQWTVKNHVQSILRRLESSSRAHAISRAISLGILEPD
ncbi:MAG: hypothetical protein KGI90_07795 [Burkholderiales bacterium]|nr:hypothetical protein [Burkholderiales bacterium]